MLASSCLVTVRSQQDFAAQYHIQTDLGADRFFRFQTHSGQYRKEILHPDGSQEVGHTDTVCRSELDVF